MQPPYYAVIFTNKLTNETEGYSEMAEKMETLAKQQPGYLGIEHAREALGITISYWESLDAISHWKSQLDHQEAQRMGKKQWYQWYTTRICKVERAYSFEKA
ncbi:MAG: antibiotic biosynthesis monooxygenase [Bacteroidetes bacterium]|nr:antibiotic biosynthesis monooxygenase [Bacteroidota bacterium]